MAGPDDDSDDRGGEAHAPRECMACRGSGSVISNLGGTPNTVACPWCRGTGMRVPEIDAQAHWGGQAQDAEPSGEGETGGEAAGDGAEDAPDGADSAA
jgi:DnaJ-class molecular chaperone